MATKKGFALPVLSLALVSGSLGAAERPLEAQALARVRSQEGLRAEAAIAHLRGLRGQLGLDARHDFRRERLLTDELGHTHVRFQQLFDGVPVLGAQAITHTDAAGAALPPTHKLHRGIELNVRPSISPEEALAAVHQQLRPEGPYAVRPEARLFVLPRTEERVRPAAARKTRAELNAEDLETVVTGYRLVYQVHVFLDNPQDGIREINYTVDAHTGAIVSHGSNLHTAAASGSGKSQYSGTVSIQTNSVSGGYELRDTTRGSGGNVTKDFKNATMRFDSTGNIIDTGAVSMIDSDGSWGDGLNFSGSGASTANRQTAAVDAHYGLQVTWDFYRNVFGRNGIDNAGRATTNYVHVDNKFVNAFWNDDCFCMHYGDGDSSQGFSTVTALDVAGHEMSHGVCAFSAGLNYGDPNVDRQGAESGGLNESNSDIFGTLVEYYQKGGGTGAAIPNTGGNFTIGERLSSAPLRYMYKPSLDGLSPDAWYAGMAHDTKFASQDFDSGDPHLTSGPMNRCFYFMSQGATTSGNTSSSYLPSGMSGVGNDHAGRIWYRTLTTKLVPTSTYLDARNGAIASAKELYGAGSAEEQAVWNAFAGINVGQRWTNQGVSVALSPATVSLNGGAAQQFTATVTGSTNTAVTWSVLEAGGGSVTSAGLYTAPAAAGTYHVKATSQADSTKSATATVTVGTSKPELIANGGFESGATGWSGTTGDIGAFSGQPTHSGAKDAWLCGNGTTATESLSQSITVPASGATLSFWLHIDSAETTTTTAYDKLQVQVVSGTTTTTLATYSNLNKAAGYSQKSLSLAAYAGKTVTIKFLGTEDTSDQTSFVLDDVSAK